VRQQLIVDGRQHLQFGARHYISFFSVLGASAFVGGLLIHRLLVACRYLSFLGDLDIYLIDSALNGSRGWPGANSFIVDQSWHLPGRYFGGFFLASEAKPGSTRRLSWLLVGWNGRRRKKKPRKKTTMMTAETNVCSLMAL
jgi:hypothetical protein